MKTPWHLWVVGLASLIWNGFGALDYALTQLDVAAWVANMPDGMREHLRAYPVWMDAVWALAVWVPVLAALLLLGRRKVAAGLYGIGFTLVLFAGIWNYLLSVPPLHAVAGIGIVAFWAVVLVLALLQWLYARAMAQAGVIA